MCNTEWFFFLNQLIKKWLTEKIETTLEFFIHLNQDESYGRRWQSCHRSKDAEGENSQESSSILQYSPAHQQGVPVTRFKKKKTRKPNQNKNRSLNISLMKKNLGKKVTNLSKAFYVSI